MLHRNRMVFYYFIYRQSGYNRPELPGKEVIVSSLQCVSFEGKQRGHMFQSYLKLCQIGENRKKDME